MERFSWRAIFTLQDEACALEVIGQQAPSAAAMCCRVFTEEVGVGTSGKQHIARH